MKATTAIIICLLGLTVAFVMADEPPRPKVYDQFTCTKCNYTASNWFYGNAISMGQFWENGPTGQSRRFYLRGSTKTPTIYISNYTTETDQLACYIDSVCDCDRFGTKPNIFTLLNSGSGYFVGHEIVRGIKCDIWYVELPQWYLWLWIAPKDANGFNKPMRYKETDTYVYSPTTIDFLEVTYGEPDPSLFVMPADCHVHPSN